jgi:Tfp pilus assembly protein PilN
VLLCGGSAGLPYIREFFSEKLQMPIEFFNPLRNVRVAAGVDAEEAGRKAHIFGELVGLAIRSACEAPMELNLEPASVTKNKLVASKRPFMIMAGLCILLSLAGCWLYFLRATQVKNDVIDKLVPQVKSLQALSAEFDKARTDIQAAKASAEPFVTAVQERDYWARLINDFNSRLPPQYIWITGFGFPPASGPGAQGGGGFHGGMRPGNTLRLHGLFLMASNTGLVDEFADNLRKSPFVASANVSQRATLDAAYWDFNYEIQVELKPGMAPQ